MSMFNKSKKYIISYIIKENTHAYKKNNQIKSKINLRERKLQKINHKYN